MKKFFMLSVLLLSAYLMAYGQDKDAIAKVYYINAEDFYNKGTVGGAEKCIEELDKAEEALGSTNSKILYLKIMAANKFDFAYYNYDMVIWLKKFFKITDAKVFPANKYADIVNSKPYKDYLIHQFVEDAGFESKMKNDSVFIKRYADYNPSYKYTSDALYQQGWSFWHEGMQSFKKGQDNEGVDEGFAYLSMATDKGSKTAMVLLSRIYGSGVGIPKDEKQSLEYALKSNDISQIASVYSLYGEKVITDGQKVIDWCTATASFDKDETTTQDAMKAIAKIYEKGLGGIPRDNYKAMEWYIKANDKGCNCKVYIDNIMILGIRDDDNKTQKAVRQLYNDWFKSKK